MQVFAPSPGQAGRVAEPTADLAAGPPEPSDAQYVHLLKEGALFGTPVLYAIVAGVCWLAAPGNVVLLLAVLWPALFAGWYFGAMVALTMFELQLERVHRRQQDVPYIAAGKPLGPTHRPVPAH
jgi:hypothetical protein